MSRKWFGRIAALLAVGLAGHACMREIPGDPEAVMERYVKAVQTSDFKTVYSINRVTARQVKYLGSGDSSTRESDLKQNMERNREMYDAVRPTFTPGVQWAERFFFTASSAVTVEKAHWLQSYGSDTVNADHEKTLTVIVPVRVVYPNQRDAPPYQDGWVRSAQYDCALSKIREGGNVTIYSHDTQWYFGGCIVDKASIRNF